MKFGRTGLAVLGLFAVAAVGCPQPSHKTFNDAGDETGGEGGEDGSGGSKATGGKSGGTGGSTGGSSGSTGGSSGSTGGSSGDGGSGGSGGSTGGSGGAKMDGGAGMGGGDAGGGASGGASMAGFMAVYTGVIMPKCGPMCHITGAPGGLGMMSAMAAYTNLVGKASACANLPRVTPGDPTKSVLSLIVKGGVMGCATRGAQMPKGRMALSAAEIKMIDDWIKGP